jgi:hypothetical protein
MMRFTTALLGLAAASLAAAASAQATGQPAQTPAPAQRGLPGLENTVSQLQDNPPPPADAPAATPAPAPSATPAPAHPRTIVPREQQAEEDHAHLEAAALRGRLLGAIAQAGQIGTRDMLAHVSDPNGAGISGWIALPDANAVTVVFYAAGANGAPPSSVYRVSIVGGRVTGRQTFLTGTRPALGPHEARMAAARAATDALDHHPCGGDDFNVFVVPPSAPDAPIDVYQLSPQTQRGHFPLGGHFKSTIARDGSVVASTALAAACVDLVVPEAATGPLNVADLADPLPTELQVFLSIWTNHPLIVAAGDPPRLFGVTSEGIRPVHE